MKRIVILGSTGSIGKQTLDVIRSKPEHFQVLGLAAGRNWQDLVKQVAEFQPLMYWAESFEADAFEEMPAQLTTMEEMVQHPMVDLVMVATTGRAGLMPTLSALRLGKTVALANKEVIVMAGELIKACVDENRGVLLPVDSEPSAIWQCMQGENQVPKSLIITASGGPFRQRPLEELKNVTVHEALSHPTWVMGRKITIDSSTLMNKGFEVIESRWLFDMPFDRIDVVVHPQSIVHSMVVLADGSVKAQLGLPDMRFPIQYALSYPDRIFNEKLPDFDPLLHSPLTFEGMDHARYPCFRLAVEAGETGGTYPAVLSAADEEAVGLFLSGRICFPDIYRIVSETLEAHDPVPQFTMETILDSDAWARRFVHELIAGH